MIDALILALRLLAGVLSLWLMVECLRVVRRDARLLTDKGKGFYMVWLGWGLVIAYGVSEQIVTDAPNGFRTIGTLAILIASIYVVRLPGGTRYEGETDPLNHGG